MHPRFLIRLPLLAMLFASAAIAAEPAVISGPTQSPPYRILDHSITGQWESAIWNIAPEIADTRTSADGKTLTWTGPPGTYTVQAILVNFTAKKIQQGKIVVTIGDPPKPPDPEPGPGPKPPDPPLPPGPTPGAKQIAFLVESNDLDNLPAAQRTLLGSLKIREAIKAKGHTFVGVLETSQKATAPAAVAPFYGAAEGKPLPQVGLAPATGGTITCYPLPATEEELWKLIGGGK